MILQARNRGDHIFASSGPLRSQCLHYLSAFFDRNITTLREMSDFFYHLTIMTEHFAFLATPSDTLPRSRFNLPAPVLPTIIRSACMVSAYSHILPAGSPKAILDSTSTCGSVKNLSIRFYRQRSNPHPILKNGTSTSRLPRL
jgi:hypothetical protein